MHGNVRAHRIFANLSGSSGRPRISRLADGIDLGLGAVGQAAETADCTIGPVFNRFRSRYGVSPARGWDCCLCSRDSRLPVLRPPPYADIRVGIRAFDRRDRSRNRWRLATEFASLARPGFGGVHACILDGDGRG